MRPITLAVSGFTCFRDDQPSLDFSGLDLFAIAGPTGAGKSSVLDAITYALYGKVPRMGGQRTKELISHGRDRMTVTLAFAVNGDRYVVSRTTRRSGNGVCQLDRLVPGGRENVASGVTSVNDAARRLVGLDYDAFTQAVVLPQGEFARFLKGAAADRRRILQELLRLTVYNRMREMARQRCVTARARVDVIEQQLQPHALVTLEAVAQLEAERSSLVARVADLQRGADAARQHRDALAAHIQLARDIAERRAELTGVLQERPAHDSRMARLERSRRAKQLAGSLDRLERDTATHAARVREAQLAAAHLSDVVRLHERAGAACERARAAHGELPALRARLDALRALEGRIRHRDACRADSGRLAQSLRLAREELRIQAAAVVQGEAQLEVTRAQQRRAESALARLLSDTEEWQACERGRDRALELRRDRLAIGGLDARRREAGIAVDEARRSHAAHDTALAGARDALDRAIQERNDAWQHQRAVLDAHRAMTLRAHLEPGHTCPVCEQGVGVVPAVETPPGLKEADAAVNETAEAVRHGEIAVRHAEEAALRAAAAHAGAESSLVALERERLEVTARIAASEEQLRATLGGYLPSSAERMPEHWLLERLEDLRAGQATREAAQRASQVARETAIGAAGALALAVEKRDACARESTSFAHQLEAKHAELAAVDADIALVTGADDPRRETDELASRVQQVEFDMADATGALNRQAVARGAAEVALRQAERARDEAVEALQQVATHVAEALASSGFPDAANARASCLDDGEDERLRQQCEQWSERHAVVAARVADLEGRAGANVASDGQFEAAVQATAEAEEALVTAMRRRGELDAERSSLAQRLDECDALRRQLAAAGEDAATYGVLSSDLQANVFQDWLLTEVFERIVRGASARLMVLTSRYTLEWVDNEFYVVDHDNARERRTADTLSGGETFLASLALALELSEQVQRAAGAVSLDSLFIDEGFGSLDANAQEVVAAAIESLQVAGRMVGIITHVRELTDRMPACIVIDKRPDGSRWSIRAA